ncbi:MAG TPA: shikimate dehydrogenase [Gemmatimonadetes bacterium]|jgi:shikimate dehydrogenase|nr:shikimate dehydrogenase [Gemmatimonadota bacterium]
MDSKMLANDCFLLLGNPVKHSLSPLIQNAAFKSERVPRIYDKFCCEESDLEKIMRGLAEFGLGGNVTVPYKETVVNIIDQASEAVLRTGACNTFWTKDGQILGDNTDVEGFKRACGSFLGGSPKGLKVLVLGAGGVVRAVLMSLLDDEVGEIILLNRTWDRAKIIADHFGNTKIKVVKSSQELKGCEFDLIINGTSLGLSPNDKVPFDLGLVSRVSGVMDLVYGKELTRFVKSAKERGFPGVGGTEMLLQQAAVSFERWLDKPAPLDTMRRTLEDVLFEW